jgi:hypothetical protein
MGAALAIRGDVTPSALRLLTVADAPEGMSCPPASADPPGMKPG